MIKILIKKIKISLIIQIQNMIGLNIFDEDQFNILYIVFIILLFICCIISIYLVYFIKINIIKKRIKIKIVFI